MAATVKTISGKASASLVFAILGILCTLPVLGSLVGIIMGHWAKAEIRRSDGELGGGGLATAGLAIGYSGLLIIPLVIGILVAVVIPSLDAFLEGSGAEANLSRLQTIGTAIHLYAEDHDGQLPDDFAQLVDEGQLDLDSKAWVSPFSGRMPPTDIEQLRDGSGSDFIYVGQGLTTSHPKPDRVIIAYTRPDIEGQVLMAFVFLDGHTEDRPVDSVEEGARGYGWRIGAQPAPPKIAADDDPPPEDASVEPSP